MDNWGVPGHGYSDSPQYPHCEAGDDLEHGRGVTAAPSTNSWPAMEEDMFFDWDALYGSGNPNDGLSLQNTGREQERTSWTTLDSQFNSPVTPLPPPAGRAAAAAATGGEHLSTSNTQDLTNNTLTHPDIPLQFQLLNPPLPLTPGPPQVTSGFNNVAAWLDGAYRPSIPCDHCRRHRLQCLILRRTSDNPNPVPSCSSCVGLFRPCSFGRGEKRQPSGFETVRPVLGHLHGVLEEGDHQPGNEGEGGSARRPDLDVKDNSNKQFVRKGARVLRDWFYRNEEHPYPSEEEKTRLAGETGFSKQRISTWFANARRRYKQQREVKPSARIYRAGSPMPTPISVPENDAMEMTPMERWQASPPDEEPVSEDVIREAIATGTSASSDSGLVGTSSTDLSSTGDGSSLASSLSSFGIPASDASDSSSSAWSFRSGEGFRSRPYHRPSASGGRRGRKRTTEDGHFHCTFCTSSFKKKHDWARHEKSVHLPLDVWVCTPNLHELENSGIPLSECRFCEQQSPTQDHWESHDFRECASKPLHERSFNRKDYLWQHLRKFHGCTRYSANLDTWRSSQGEIQSRCGFCAAPLPNWSARADHLAAHFKEGCRMSQWAGDWGFEPSVLANLRNAVLPFERAWCIPAPT